MNDSISLRVLFKLNILIILKLAIKLIFFPTGNFLVFFKYK